MKVSYPFVTWLTALSTPPPVLGRPFVQVAQLSQRDRATHELLRFAIAKLRSGIFEPPFGRLRAVSYTHLTLPTIYSV